MMNLKNENDRNSFFSVLMLAVALVLLGGTAVLVAKIAAADSNKTVLTDEFLAQIKPDAEKTKEYLQAYKKVATDLTEQNMFVPKSDEVVEPGECTAIFGAEARIGNRWYSTGDRVGDARIESIEPTVVTLLFEDRRITRKPVMVAENNSRDSRNRSQNQQSSRGNRGGRGTRGSDSNARSANIDRARQTEIADRVRAFTESDAGRQIQAYWTEGDGREMINNFMTASPEERQQQIQQFRQQFQGGNFQFRTSTNSGGQTEQQTIIIRQD
ncbi:MAG: hypothetical protein GY869_23425 [Planctomycetes bacterium]|nr:hypothetical protein [Planctomycetota bacterium]